MCDDQLEFDFMAELERDSRHYIPYGWFVRGFVHAWLDGTKMRYTRTAAHKPDKRCPACARGERK